MEKLHAQLAQAEEKLGDSELYDQSRKAELTACLQQQASAKSGLEECEMARWKRRNSLSRCWPNSHECLIRRLCVLSGILLNYLCIARRWRISSKCSRLNSLPLRKRVFSSPSCSCSHVCSSCRRNSPAHHVLLEANRGQSALSHYRFSAL